MAPGLLPCATALAFAITIFLLAKGCRLAFEWLLLNSTVVLKEQDLDILVQDARLNEHLFGHLLVWMQKPTKGNISGCKCCCKKKVINVFHNLNC